MKRIFFAKDVFFTTQNGGLSWKHDAPYLFVVSFSEMALLSSCLSNTPYWQSAWDGVFSEEEQQIKIDLLDELQAKLRGEKVELITTALNAINTTLQEMRDKMGSGSGDGEGNTIQDLIFWLKILFAISGGGGALQGGGNAPLTTTPILSQIRDESEVANTKLEEQKVELANIVTKLQGLIDKQCATVQSVRLDSGILNESTDLLRNGAWSEGGSNGVSGAFYPNYWLVVGNPSNAEFPSRALIGGVYVLVITTENNCTLRQTAIIPPGYELPKIVMTLPAGETSAGCKITVYVNNEVVPLSIVEDTATYFEADFNASARDAVKVELTAEGSSSATFGTLELLVWPTALPISNVVTLPTIGGSMGKGRKIVVQPDKKKWEVIDSSGSNTLVNWIIGKLDATADWVSMRLLSDDSEEQELQIAQEFKLDASVNVCHVNFTMSGGETPITRIELFNDGVWEYFRDCTGSGDFSVTVPLGEISGDEKRIRMFVSVYQPVDGIPFDLYGVELELID